MLRVIKGVIFYGIWCVVCCHCFEQLCDVERWLSDNGTPVNRLDISSYAKTRLLKSLQSPDRLIKCSVLRAIHKEADLDQTFKQSRYKVSNREIKSRQKDRESDDKVKDERDSSHRSSSLDEKLLDAIEGASGDRRSPERWEDDGRIPESAFGREASLDDSRVSAQASNMNSHTEAQQEQKKQEKEQQAEQNTENQSDTSSTPNKTTVTPTDENQTTIENVPPSVGVIQNVNQSQELVQQLQQDVNVNLTNQSIAVQNRTENITQKATELTSLMQKCFTTTTKIVERSKSSKFCRIFYKSFTTQTNKSEILLKRFRSPNITLHCRSCTRHHLNNSFMHFCEVFFPVQKVTKLEKFFDRVLKGNETDIRNLHNEHINRTAANRTVLPVTDFTDLILSCRQCLATNVSHKICLISCTISCAQSEKSHTARAEHSLKLMADKLQFIDDKESSLNAGATAKTAEAGRDLQENELPTRARKDTQGRQVNNRPNQTLLERGTQDAPFKNESSTTQEPVVDGTDTVAKQLEILSHSVFMEKLFDNLLSRRSAQDSTELRTNLSRSINLVNTRLDHVTNMTVANRDRNVELKINLSELEARLSLALVQMTQLNRRLQKQIQKLETRALGRLVGCETQLNKTRLQYEALGRRQSSQLVKLEKRIRQISNRLNKTQGCDCRPIAAAAQPAMPPMHQQPHYSPLHHQLLHQQQQHFFPNTVDVILPNVDGKSKIYDCSDTYTQESAKHPDRPGEISDGVFPANLGRNAPALVRCDMRHEGWTYILSRSNGQTDFFRNWTSYQSGFGEPSGEHFIGLEALAEMTSQRQYRLWVELEDWEGTIKHVNYERFIVLGSQYNYQLHVDRFHGDASVGDSLSSHSNASFSTYDLDNDLVDKKFGGNCAKRFRGGFWYFSCYRANPTGQYYEGGKIPGKRCDGIVWKTWKGPHYSLKSIHMKIKPQ